MCLWLSRLIGAIFKKNNSMAIRLLINGTQADLGNNAEGLLLFNYGAGDLDAPAVVQNAYSKEVVLPPTQENARLFGAWMQPDKVRGTADGFDALARVPFQIRDNGDEVLEAGYVKLESVSADGYAIHLYGGLGGFLYGLMYGEDGEKKTLASLRWSDAIEEGLSFNISKDLVAAAWTRLRSVGGVGDLSEWADILNFAPMHNGKPSDFDCNKALVPIGAEHGCPAVSGAHGINGCALVEFAKELDEWEVRDLRSYLQRPIISTRGILAGIEKVAADNGHSFDWSAIANEWFVNSWMTLPMLHREGQGNTGGELGLSWYTTNRVSDINTGATPRLDIDESIDPLARASYSLGISLALDYTRPTGETIYGWSLGRRSHATFIFVRVFGYDGDTEVARSKVRCLCIADYASETAARLAFESLPSTTGSTDGVAQNTYLGAAGAGDFEIQVQEDKRIAANFNTDTMQFDIEGFGIDNFRVAVEAVTFAAGERIPAAIGLYTGGNVPTFYPAINYADITLVNPTYTAESTGRVGTGTHFSKADILGGTASPADWLLSFVKTFGLVLRYDAISKAVAVVPRDAFYSSEGVDISPRIDRSKAYKVEPNIIAEKWLRFAFGDAAGAYAEAYRAKYGSEYGAQRVNTGSPFNAETLQVLEGVGSVQGVTGLAYSRYFWLLEDTAVGSGVLPSGYLDGGAKYTVWDAQENPAQYDIKPLTANLSLTGINAVAEMDAPGYDGFFRLQLANADGQPDGDGAGILLLYDGSVQEYVALSDDTPEMLAKNDGVPCWFPYLGSTPSQSVPHFGTYTFLRAWGGVVENSLDMGAPRQVDMPRVNYDEGRSIYARRWRAYIADRYNENSHRVTCWVDWRGMKIGQDLFRPFYWFDGCWWVLEKISDYCWDNPQPCECTFVRVLDKGAYTNGQN